MLSADDIKLKESLLRDFDKIKPKSPEEPDTIPSPEDESKKIEMRCKREFNKELERIFRAV